MLREVLGQVTAAQANFYRVATSAYGELLCTSRARLKKTGQWVLVGDQVLVEEIDPASKRGAIGEIIPRRNQLDQPPIANVDQLLLMLALAEPALEIQHLSRFLVKAESTKLPFILALNKADLCERQTIDDWQEKLHAWGYQPIIISTTTGQNLSELKAHLAHKITVITGSSGVGKSSLINRLIPGAHLATGSVAQRTGRGRHTTRHIQLLPLDTGGMIADTPGFNQPNLEMKPTELAQCFPEIYRQNAACEFADCTHQDEPGCNIDKHWERYEHYVQWWQELQELAILKQMQGRCDVGVKYKQDGMGQRRSEPKLARHKYRSLSRRRQHQELDLLTADDESI
ncbi:MAG: ribosome small subunit-dependent GTPase A [Gloeomargarita sp. DG02_4_bins_56]